MRIWEKKCKIFEGIHQLIFYEKEMIIKNITIQQKITELNERKLLVLLNSKELFS